MREKYRKGKYLNLSLLGAFQTLIHIISEAKLLHHLASCSPWNFKSHPDNNAMLQANIGMTITPLYIHVRNMKHGIFAFKWRESLST